MIVPIRPEHLELTYRFFHQRLMTANRAQALTSSFAEHKRRFDAGVGWVAFDHRGNVKAYILASIEEPPPVYDVGGSAIYISEFLTTDLELGREVAYECIADLMKKRQSVQLIANLFHNQEIEEKLLVSLGLIPTTNWWHLAVLLDPVSVQTRRASSSEVTSIVQLILQRYEEYEKVRPDFWRRSPDCEAILRSYIGQLIVEQDTYAGLVGTVGDPRGCIIARPKHNHPDFGFESYADIDDFTVVDPKTWLTTGADLIRDCAKHMQHQKVRNFLVTCAVHDSEKEALLIRNGGSRVNGWLSASINHILL